jgi:hypothetical protein
MSGVIGTRNLISNKISNIFLTLMPIYLLNNFKIKMINSAEILADKEICKVNKKIFSKISTKISPPCNLNF